MLAIFFDALFNKQSFFNISTMIAKDFTFSMIHIDEKVEDANDTTIVCSAVSRRDMATQMSPVDSDHSSPRRRSSFSRTNHSILPIIELQSSCSSQPEVRDVEIDERVSVSKWPRKNKSRSSSKGSGDIDNWKLKVLGARSSPWDVSERSKSLARYVQYDQFPCSFLSH